MLLTTIIILVPLGLVVLLLVAVAVTGARPGQETQPPRPGSWMGIGIGMGILIGLVLGLGFGFVLENMPVGVAIGPAIGVAIGTAIGIVIEARYKNPARTLTADEQRERTLVAVLAGVILLFGLLVLAGVQLLK